METREMKRLSILGMAALMAAAVSCKKSGDDAQAPVQGAFRAVAEAQADDSKTGLSSNLAVTWTSGDEITIIDNTSLNEATIRQGDFKLVSGAGTSSGEFNEPAGGVPDGFYSGDYSAFYPKGATYDKNAHAYKVRLNSTQMYLENSFGDEANPMAAKATSTSLSFSNLCGTLRLSLMGNKDGMTVTSIRVTTKRDERLNGWGKVSFDGTTPTLDMAGGEVNVNEKSVTLTCTGSAALPVATGDPTVDVGKQFNIVLPAGSLGGGFEIDVEFAKSDNTKGYFKKSVSGIVDNSIVAGRIRNMPVLRMDCGFVVDNKTGRTVEFAKGNLYYEPAKEENGTQIPEKWGIEKHQWAFDTLSPNASDPSVASWNPKHVSHFYWTSNADKARAALYVGEGTTFFTEVIGGFKAEDVDNEEKSWRTLTEDEWECIINGRTAYFQRWARVKMRPTPPSGKGVPTDDVPGLLLFPAELAVSANTLNGSSLQTSGTINWEDVSVVNESDFDTKYPGCIFLPCAGYRDGTTYGTDGSFIGYVGNYGYCWTSSMNMLNTSQANIMGVGNNVVHTYSFRKSDGRCVRLVRF